jgi:hypothetical protein
MNDQIEMPSSEPGRVAWGEMKAELMGLPKETLAEMVNMWVKNYWTLQSYWMVFIERDYGFEAAGRLDGEVWEKLARTQAGRLKKLLGLGSDTQALATALKFTAPQWAPAGFDWKLIEIGERILTMEVNKCPMGTYRDGLGLERLPCKLGSDRLYRALAKVINPKFEVICLHAHPDPCIEGVMCQWKFNLED